MLRRPSPASLRWSSFSPWIASCNVVYSRATRFSSSCFALALTLPPSRPASGLPGSRAAAAILDQDMGGPDIPPDAPRRSERHGFAGFAGALLDSPTGSSTPEGGAA